MCSQRRPGRRKVISVSGAPPSSRIGAGIDDGGCRSHDEARLARLEAPWPSRASDRRLTPPPLLVHDRARAPGPSGRRRRGRCGRRSVRRSTICGARRRRRETAAAAGGSVAARRLPGHPDEDHALALGDRIAAARGCARYRGSARPPARGWPRRRPSAPKAPAVIGAFDARRPSASRANRPADSGAARCGQTSRSAKSAPSRRTAQQHRLAEHLQALHGRAGPRADMAAKYQMSRQEAAAEASLVPLGLSRHDPVKEAPLLPRKPLASP